MLYNRLERKDELQALVKQLLTLQKDDGGWSQTMKLKSNALGTGQALVALSSAGLTAEDHGRYESLGLFDQESEAGRILVCRFAGVSGSSVQQLHGHRLGHARVVANAAGE